MHGLYVLWWVQYQHVPVAVVAAVLAAGDLAITALELPSGWFADRRGHRASLLVGSTLQVLGMVWAWLGRGVPGLLAASLFVAAGDAFRSGADQALLYRSCAAEADPSFQRREAHARALQLAALVLFVLAGGAIVDTWGFDAGWLIETATCGIGLLLAWAMVEPPCAVIAAIEDDEQRGAGIDRSPESETQGFGDAVTPLLAMILPTAALVAAASAALFLVQADVTLEPAGMTASVAAATLAEAAGALVGARIPAGIARLWVVAAVGAPLAAAALAVPGVFYPALAAAFFMMGLAEPLRAAAIQRTASDGVRARAASLASACDKVFTTTALLVAGAAARRRA